MGNKDAMFKNCSKMIRGKSLRVSIVPAILLLVFVLVVRGQNDYSTIEQAIMLSETWKNVGKENGKQVVYLYNQFNPVDYVTNGVLVVPAGTPNMSSDGKGWGIGQIGGDDYPDKKVPSAVVWNWQTNVNEMIRIVQKKRVNQADFILHQQRYCLQNGIAWVDPPATYTTNGITWDYIEWGALILYNGAGTNAIPKSWGINGVGEVYGVRSPWAYTNGGWILYDNDNNYMRKVIEHIHLINTNGVIVKE